MTRDTACATLMLLGWEMAIYRRTQPVVVNTAAKVAMSLGTRGLNGPRVVQAWLYHPVDQRLLSMLEHFQTFSDNELRFLAHAAAQYLPAGQTMECRQDILRSLT